ncbi:LysE family translocator [Desulfogranum marinum]|uniref:LysE family translocator n=1 Tax=Desulfogranum marinum TaxID=453220 RepID=UPI0029C6459C|nr:LysE family translocator [Desulfogranum marinum]
MEFVLIASAHFLALLSPGPDFFLIMQTALRMPMRYALSVCAGIAAANGLYLTIAVLGLEAVRNMHLLMTVLKYLGSGYLIYIGYLLLRAPKRPLTQNEKQGFLRQQSFIRQFTLGFASACLNPKNAIFYLSLFTVMVSAETPLAIRTLYGLWMAGIVFTWDMGVAMLIGNRRAKNYLEKWIFGLEKISGLMLSLFGILLCLD